MSEATVKAVPGFVGRLADALRQDMPGATVDTEHIRGNRYRFLVEWDQFTGVGHPERQRRVWAVAEKVVPRADMLDVGMILTIAPDEHY